ncbi:MAG: XkdX family protein [Candidatus Cloacimonetes bacterium]|nr:XkdX family protein [Candidatus Cloacimonadota bacterium]
MILLNDFERIKLYFSKNWCNKEQLRQYVEFNKITQEEYKIICGENY